MRRAMRTVRPLSEAMSQGVLVHPEVFENGGTFGVENGEFVAGKGMTRDESCFPRYDVGKLPEKGVWLGALKRENMDEARARARRVAEWVVSQEVKDLTSGASEQDRASLVVVCH
eukprot:CAMPEP_0206274318 /NCGR_PEP_ID=MMETSP0047_2-20121206/35091_1 /ASSEMBLY_ACC=CAM_ASM_000192 /TAXON_ID=195065 /ORGANISM="Chroomonas mesostigmatica_cf, Strain CCMP1168" /LENGTH=114 /DNA_ID=CAMNT_0053703525 /DNA_START=180 /DNA_END=522 /DNA_ORIENTATION=+